MKSSSVFQSQQPQPLNTSDRLSSGHTVLPVSVLELGSTRDTFKNADKVLDGIRVGDIISTDMSGYHCLVEGLATVNEYLDATSLEVECSVILDVLWLTDTSKLEAGLNDTVTITRYNRRMWRRVA